MSAVIPIDTAAIRCPACGGGVSQLAGERRVCSQCARAFACEHGILDLRKRPEAPLDPAPLERGDLDGTFARAASGVPYRAALEALLLDLPDARADRLMLLLREARGAWFPLLRAGGGELLFIGNALSGTITPLCDAGFRVSVLDRSLERLRFASFRSAEHTPGLARFFLGGDAPRLPFADAAYDVVVQEDGLPGATRVPATRRARGPEPAFRPGLGFEHDLAECARVARGELVLTGDNRLGYKRSSGRRGEFHVPGPFEYLSHAIAPRSGERTLAGYRRAFATAGRSRTRAFALYPHSGDFSHVVAIDEPAPALTIGPMERKNRAKLAARALGLFPVLTPSFAIIGEPQRALDSAGGSAKAPALVPVRIERILRELAQRIDEPVPVIEQLVSTRGNTAIVHTQVPGAMEHDPRGRWTLHVPLAPKNIPQCELHFRTLEHLRAHFPSVPVPQALFLGRIDGVSVTCERRARGWTAPQMSGDARIARMLADTAEHFARLVVRAAAPLTAEEFAEQVSARFGLVSSLAAVPSTVASLARLHDEMRERMIGRNVARVIYHADLRAKHVQVDETGRVTAYLDWGTTERAGLPYHDLLHLLVHERKQERGLTARAAWQLVQGRVELRDHERAALASYAAAVGLDDDTCRAFESMYPVLVAAMAEKNWAYSRPRWLHKQFGL
jgi:aminoglycoside phosphotransferase (APT) family kinase protein